YRQLFENNPHPMWVYDIDNLAFLAVNDAAVETYGYSRDEFLGMTIKDIRPVEELPALEKYLARDPQAFKQAGEWHHVKRDVSILEVEVTPHEIPFTVKHGRLVMTTDITEQKRIEAQLLRAQRMESIGPLAGGIAHDLNNVLAPILTGMDMLRERINDASS